ncbi:sugar-binding transcriptional regulator [Clostridium psychrophilum]|uniref:sugar-binding transcriptional regulator n=1 Tax=Clostridium psychrophilum TaxID=132926 RepID=UPI001C0D5F07|nr:sugar-binding transcriptional regulator [Clostridium psychrophilum]MBU3181662.1 sugar-binding transcriptional regulator [Clostridium psychrophilum]
MDNEKQKLSVKVAKLYYQSDYSQQQVASELGISRPTISRLLQYAKEKGYVKININDPFSDLDKLSCKLKEKYGLNDIRVVFSPRDDYVSSLEYISKEAAEYLHETIKNGDVIGVSWGTTMYEVAKKLTPQNTKGVEVVQLKGGISHSEVNTYASETISLFAGAFQTLPRYFPLPVIFDSCMIREMVEKDSNIRNIIEMGIKANVAIFTVGTVRDEALLFRLGYLNDTEKQSLKQKSVGDICSRFFDKNGEICNDEINNRTMGISIDALKKKEKSILVACGKLKLNAIRAALKAKIANILITDQYSAKELLK